MKIQRDSWERVKVTLILVIKGNKVLLGQILGGTIAGFLTPPGGKVDKSDKNIKAAAIRELHEETHFRAKEMHEVATVKIKITGKRRTLVVHLFKCKSWTGRLRREKREFSYLKFFTISKIPWEKMAPGDEEWMKRLLKGEHLRVDVLCGEKRTDLREIKITILP